MRLLSCILMGISSIIGASVFATTPIAIKIIGGNGIVVGFICAALFVFVRSIPEMLMVAALPANGGSYMYLPRLVHPILGTWDAFNELAVGVLNGGTRYEQEWPLARTQWKKLYLRSFNRLRWDREPDEDLPPDGFTHLPPSTSTEVNKLVYRSSRFAQTKEITGPIELHLWASIDAQDANFVCSIFDILPDGSRMPLLRYGALRASHPLKEEESQIGRPVHDNSVSIPVTPGEIREYVIEISPTSMIIPAGHSLELEVASQCPNACHTQSWTNKVGNMNVVPSNTTTSYKIYKDQNHPSYLLLPMVPYTDPQQWVQPFEDDYQIEVDEEA
ncbi:MAG: CocE/NonD family hydrolase C-terminal non-catalytic domain-containing protein [Eubacteriales bacterium]|nr:CocE/NonD family hydrolase C-terminal non-catalytic domain-containing protein [Eubacteriales bacterium]